MPAPGRSHTPRPPAPQPSGGHISEWYIEKVLAGILIARLSVPLRFKARVSADMGAGCTPGRDPDRAPGTPKVSADRTGLRRLPVLGKSSHSCCRACEDLPPASPSPTMWSPGWPRAWLAGSPGPAGPPSQRLPVIFGNSRIMKIFGVRVISFSLARQAGTGAGRGHPGVCLAGRSL